MWTTILPTVVHGRFEMKRWRGDKNSIPYISQQTELIHPTMRAAIFIKMSKFSLCCCLGIRAAAIYYDRFKS